jgi:hypothetical protein
MGPDGHTGGHVTGRQTLELMAELHAAGRAWIASADLVEIDRTPPHASVTLNRLYRRGMVDRRAIAGRDLPRAIWEYRVANREAIETAQPIG